LGKIKCESEHAPSIKSVHRKWQLKTTLKKRRDSRRKRKRARSLQLWGWPNKTNPRNREIPWQSEKP